MKRFPRTVLGIALLATALAGCGSSKPTDSAATPAGSGLAKTQPILVDVIPTQKSDTFEAEMNKLGALLSQESGLQVKVRIAADYASVVEAMRFNKTDVAYFGPFTYVVANAQSGAQAFITMNIHGKPYYYSYAIATVLKFQFHDYIAKNILHQPPQHCSYAGNKEVGDFLRKMLSTGGTRDWRQLLHETTGEDLSTRAMKEYFAPLMAWLEEQNKGRQIGWE